MKLILENWNKFLKEQEINEATQQEIEYLNDALEIPIEELPFGNIFGDSYRIIEPLNSLDETSSFGVAMKALAKMGWEVGSPKDGKILCSKTKVSHYIDGKGNQGISRKTTSLNLPKVLAGIVNFVKSTRVKLATAAGDQITTSVKRYFDNIEQKDAKYDAPIGIKAKMTANEYRTAYKFFDAQNYWVGDVGDQKMAADLSKFFKSKNINFESFENFAKYASDSFDDLLANMDQYIQKSYIIYSRHPVDVFRMSDHEGIQSCHSLPSEKGDDRFDQFNKCALSEAYGNGMIAYIVPAKDFKMFPPTQESLDKFGDQEIFYDQIRPFSTTNLIQPTSRIRIKSVAFHKDENSEPIRLAVPQGKVYGPKVPGFNDAVNNKISTAQEKQIKEIIKQGSEDLGKPTIFLSKFTRYGGSYQDTGYSVAQTLPMLFRKYSRDLVLQGDAVRYEPDIEEALMGSIGQNGAEVMSQRLNEIFDNIHNTVGGFVSCTWDVEEDYDGEPYYRWRLLVTFQMNIPSDTNGSEISNAVVDAADSYFPDYYGLPETDNVFVSKYDENRWQIQLVYDGNDFDDTSYVDGLERNLPDIVQKFNVFDYYYEDGAIQMIEYQLEEYRVIEAERHNVQNVMRDFNLPDDSWWNEDEREMGETDYFGGEYLESISFEDYTSLSLAEIKDKIPENMKQEAYKHIADFLNLVTKSDELAGKLALNQDNWDKIKDPNIVISYDQAGDLKPEELDQADVIEMKAGVSMFTDYPVQRLQKTAYFLKNNASIDDINERILAALEKYVADKLKGKQPIKENKKRIRIHVRR